VQLADLLLADGFVLDLAVRYRGDEFFVVVQLLDDGAVVFLLDQFVHVDQILGVRLPLELREQAAADQVDLLRARHDQVLDLLLLQAILDALDPLGDHTHLSLVSRLETLFHDFLFLYRQVVQLLR